MTQEQSHDQAKARIPVFYRPEMNATSRESRSSLATMTGHFCFRPAVSAATN